MELVQFLDKVITTPEGWFCLAHVKIEGDEDKTKKSWREEFFKWPEQKVEIINRVASLEGFDVYFSPHLFSAANSKKESVLPTRTIVADLDDANILTLGHTPTILVETSPDRHQGYWIIKDQVSLDELENASKKLTYSIPRCDHSGWFIGHKYRVPTTTNYKYTTGPKYIKVVRDSGVLYNFAKFQELASINELLGDAQLKINDDLGWVDEALATDIGPQELLNKIRSSLPARIVVQYNIESPDRSTALWGLMQCSFRAGLDKLKVFWLAYHSANNKFKDLKFGGVRELAKDVLRAELDFNRRVPNVIEQVINARRLPGLASERSRYIADLVRKHLETIGSFVHTVDENYWFIRKDSGRPIQIGLRSMHSSALLETLFGLNSSEKETSYVMHSLATHVNSLPQLGHVASLSYYDKDAQILLLHSGRKEVLKVTETGIDNVENGYDSIVFPWLVNGSTINPKFRALDKSWSDILFDGCLDNILGMDKSQAKAILKVWFLSILLRDSLISRPILALFGQQGCIAGATKLSVRRGTHSARDFTIAHLYNNIHGNWDDSIVSRIRSVKNGIVQWRNIEKIVSSGQKQTFTVKIKGRKSFRTTKDHLFLTPNGYKKLEDLTTGSEVIVEGTYVDSGGGSATWRPEVSVRYHPYGRSKIVNGCGPYKYVYNYRAVVEARMNHMTTEQFVSIVNSDEKLAGTMTYLPENVVIHHKNYDPYNDAYDNLEIMTKKDHDHLHAKLRGSRNFGSWSGMNYTTTSMIESIEEYGIEPTYDIQMEDEEAPNFLINGVVVHNSGKSTLFKRVYALLYGPSKSLNAISTEDHFDMAVATDPFVVFDNVDTFAKWLPDRLAISASSSEILKRRLYTDVDIIVMKRQAMLGITAHNPKFGREDVNDRLLLLTFERLKHFRSETEILDTIYKSRNELWGDILADIQKVFSTPMPLEGWPQFRIEDFAKFGFWIATALGIEQDFYDGIESIRIEQKVFSLEEDGILRDAIAKFVDREGSTSGTYRTPGQLWQILESLSGDPNNFHRKYSNAVVLGKKLWTLQDSLGDLFEVDFKYDSNKGSRTWSFMRKGSGSSTLGVVIDGTNKFASSSSGQQK